MLSFFPLPDPFPPPRTLACRRKEENRREAGQRKDKRRIGSKTREGQLTARASLVAVWKTSRTPSPVRAEHSMYRLEESERKRRVSQRGRRGSEGNGSDSPSSDFLSDSLSLEIERRLKEGVSPFDPVKTTRERSGRDVNKPQPERRASGSSSSAPQWFGGPVGDPSCNRRG